MFKWNVVHSLLQKKTFSSLKAIVKTPTLRQNKTAREILKEYGYGYGNKMIYNSKIEDIKVKMGFKGYFHDLIKRKRYKKELESILERVQPLPLTLKYYNVDVPKEEENVEKYSIHELSKEMEKEIEDDFSNEQNKHINFPLAATQPVYEYEDDKQTISEKTTTSVDELIQKKYEMLKKQKNWMASYDNYEYDLEESKENEALLEDWTVNYGTSNPNSRISSVPCGGCGALLHCKDPGIPGYIPSEIFQNYEKDGGASLDAMVCQRCYFLKEHDLALEVQVSSEDYPKILTTIRDKKALVIVMVDITDFPCSIWPGIADIFGNRTPIFIVGNKIDLLPKDDENFLAHVKQNLLNNMKIFGFGSLKILDVALISAKTEYGVDDLITTIYQKWRNKGDVYIVGCTNVGKSTLFNAFLRSDFCKVQARDLIQRATTSLWPGTTLNLLKFPILNLSHHRLYLRTLRMREMKKLTAEEDKLRAETLKRTNSIEHATLIGHIGKTFGKKVIVNENTDTFHSPANSNESGRIVMGLDKKHPEYALSKWCYDTPGVVQPDQILNLLTVDELMYVIPRELIRPETFILKPGMTIFIAGLARLDFLEGSDRARFTVFRSKELPITVCYTENSDKLYSDFLGTDLFKVPLNDGERLSKWPNLELAKTFTITGQGWHRSAKDVVLSSAGWIAVSWAQGEVLKFQAWTPEKRGVYVRDSLLPKAIELKGKKIRNSVAYEQHKLI